MYDDFLRMDASSTSHMTHLSCVQQIATAEVIQCGANLARLLPNIVGTREVKRRLVASVEHSKLLYVLPAWACNLNNPAIQKKLSSAQRGAVLTIVSLYRTVSMSAVLVLASVPSMGSLVKERQETFQLRKELTCTTNQQVAAHAEEAIRKQTHSKLFNIRPSTYKRKYIHNLHPSIYKHIAIKMEARHLKRFLC